MNEEKLARICWNTNNWQRPSGRAGKVANSRSGAYEAKTGYGYEEWLLDTSKLVNGYHYAYIQAIGQHREKYVSHVYNISFYTINSKTKERWWLGEIKNVQVVSEEESEEVYRVYKKKGWLDEMYAQLESVGADINEFKTIQPNGFFCIKFKVSDMEILEEPRQFSSKDPAIKSDYYNLKNKASSPAISVTKFKFTHGAKDKKSRTTAEYRSQSKEIDLIHNQIQVALYEHFKKLYGETNVGCEQDTGFGTKIDLVVRQGKSFAFYEVKTANTAKQCIREALSQLLEYAYYPNDERAEKLVIISPVRVSSDSRRYMNKIRTLFNIPVFYQQFDLENERLGPEC